ncbi:MAG: hypothetical protein KF845_13190 [Cyclobacteriaceae bacterium]|nr:hypothetical protein [Cyclobacteriaceae bacterium]
MKKIARFTVLTIIALAGVVVLIALFTLAPVNRTIDRSAMQEEMKQRIQNLPAGDTTFGIFRMGYAKKSLVPPFAVATAGYGKRRGKLYTAIRDSVFVRAMVVDKGITKAAIVSADLLIFPPTVTLLLEKELPSIGFSIDNTYLGATHTHNSIGNWGEGAASFLYGDYNETVVRFIADQVKACLQEASAQLEPVTVRSGVIPVPQAVRNRLIKNGPVDSLLRVIEFQQPDSSKQVLMSYTAHATCLSSSDLRISRDYPGALTDSVEARGYSFAMFLAGAVGSHACNAPEKGDDCIGWMANEVTNALEHSKTDLQTLSGTTLNTGRLRLELNNPQPKITGNLRLCSWVFRSAFGEYPVFLNALQFGNVLMLGTPCDYSGQFNTQLDRLADSYNILPIVTSFNGGYIGYVTPDRYFEENHYETRLMNWYGYGTGAYVTDCLEGLITQIGENGQPLGRPF